MAESSGPPSPKTRHNITTNACTRCRKRRTKCDGGQPCSKCANDNRSQCEYVMHSKVSKEQMQRQFNDLQQRESSSQQVLQALASNNQVSEILQSLRDGKDINSIVNMIDANTLVSLPELFSSGVQLPQQLAMSISGGSASPSVKTESTSSPRILTPAPPPPVTQYPYPMNTPQYTHPPMMQQELVPAPDFTMNPTQPASWYYPDFANNFNPLTPTTASEGYPAAPMSHPPPITPQLLELLDELYPLVVQTPQQQAALRDADKGNGKSTDHDRQQ